MMLVILLYLMFTAMTFINSKIMVANPYPFFVGMLRALSGGLFLLAYSSLLYTDELKKFSLSTRAWKDLILFGVLVHGFVLCGFSFAMQYTSPVKVCFMFATCPFITMLLEYVLRVEKLTTKKCIGLLIGMLGLVPVLLDANHGAYKDIPWHLELLGSLVTMISTACFAYGWIVMKRFLKEHAHYRIEIINGVAMLVGSVTSIVLFYVFSEGTIFDVSLTKDFYSFMMVFVLFSLTTYLIYPYLLKRYSATFLAFAGFLEPVFGLIYGKIFLGTKITPLSCFSLIVLFIGLYVYYKEEMRLHGNATRLNSGL